MKESIEEWKRPQFTELSDNRVDRLIGRGAAVSNLPNGGRLISESNSEIIYDPANLYYEKRKKENTGKVIQETKVVLQ